MSVPFVSYHAFLKYYYTAEPIKEFKHTLSKVALNVERLWKIVPKFKRPSSNTVSPNSVKKKIGCKGVHMQLKGLKALVQVT
jgi:hypothetical protein